ncbi:MAG: anthranilate synthase component I family protein, partial [Bacteroidetes bacterium]
MLADTLTPVTAYLRLRDHYDSPVLLESNDFGREGSRFSYIGLEPLARIQVRGSQLAFATPAGEERLDVHDLPAQFQALLDRFELELPSFEGAVNGLFGHTAFDAVQHFDTLRFDPDKRQLDLPDMHYCLYRYVLAFNHHKHELYLLENVPEGEPSRLDELQQRLTSPVFATYPFRLVGDEHSTMTDADFLGLVEKGRHHCQRGDVFQIVFSRRYAQAFEGDDFQVYRVLRSINPSPYLFYFDYGHYRVFGSSPEAQMVIRDGRATVNPIAGTYRRTHEATEDARRAAALLEDPKENAEHIMLVDLARNDLGRHCTDVQVEELRAVHYYSHVMHLVSKVTGRLAPGTPSLRVFGDTFPAGTLSGAPKYRALELIDRYEPHNRGFYGGAIGYIGLNGDMNQAIVIRSFCSQHHKLYYQAGAGIVIDSVPERELQEVH